MRPLPTLEELRRAAVEIAATNQGIDADEHFAAVLARFDADEGAELEGVLDTVIDEMTMDEQGEIAWLAGDRTVAVAALTEGIVHTHVLTEAEKHIGALTVAVDLAGFARRSDLSLPDGTEVGDFSAEPGHVAWSGPDGWLDRYGVGAVLAVRIVDEVVHLDVLDRVPPVDPELVARIRDAYDREVEEPWLPVRAEEIVFNLLLDDPATFAEPTAPLMDLVAAAGLELRGSDMAHDESVWAAAADAATQGRILAAFEDTEDAFEVIRAIEVMVDPDASPEELRRALRDVATPETMELVAAELAPDIWAASDEQKRAATEGAARLVRVARSPAEKAMAHFIACVVAEGCGDPVTANGEIVAAAASGALVGPEMGRAGWYASDRGDAAGAIRCWDTLVDPPGPYDTVKRFVAGPGTTKYARNEPCWCGSGRKYKQCHNQPPEAAVPLPDRVGWLCGKARLWLEYARDRFADQVVAAALARAVDDDDRVPEAFADPLTIDAVLTEGGAFAHFLEERGPLLPADEQLLAASWLAVDRSVHEVVATTPGRAMRIRDLRTGDELEVRERSLSAQVGPGDLLCARIVPDGETNQIIGGLFPVRPGTEAALLDLLDEGDPLELCGWAAAVHAPPRFATREGEPMVTCVVRLRVADPVAARRVLDHEYEADASEPDAWQELHPLSDEERILRASLTLDGDDLEVMTNSNERADRVLATLRERLAGITVLSDDRQPVRPGDAPSIPMPRRFGGRHLRDGGEGGASDSIDLAIIEEITDRIHEQWLSEPVPALDGLTPYEAAADPTRHEQIRRLLATFPRPTDLPQGALTLDPDRLLDALGLADGS